LKLLIVLVLLGAVGITSYTLRRQSNQQPTENQQFLTQPSAGERSTVQNSAEEFDLQSKCAQAAKTFFNTTGYKLTDLSSGYVSHWNKSQEKCFVEFSGSVGNRDIVYELADALGGIEYAEIEWTIPDDNNPHLCTIYPNGNGQESDQRSCKSKTEFDDFVGPFMNN